MDRVERLAREEGVSRIGLVSGYARLGAHKFYASLGYEARSYYFAKSLGRAGE